MLIFADIVKLEDRDVQQVLRGSTRRVLAVAMKGATEAVIEIILRNLSERNREILDDEIRLLGPVRLSQVEEARAEIVRAIRDLEAEGVITVQRTDEDELCRLTSRSRACRSPPSRRRSGRTPPRRPAPFPRLRGRVRRRAARGRSSSSRPGRTPPRPSACRKRERGRARSRTCARDACAPPRSTCRAHRAGARRRRAALFSPPHSSWPRRCSATSTASPPPAPRSPGCSTARSRAKSASCGSTPATSRRSSPLVGGGRGPLRRRPDARTGRRDRRAPRRVPRRAHRHRPRPGSRGALMTTGLLGAAETSFAGRISAAACGRAPRTRRSGGERSSASVPRWAASTPRSATSS